MHTIGSLWPCVPLTQVHIEQSRYVFRYSSIEKKRYRYPKVLELLIYLRVSSSRKSEVGQQAEVGQIAQTTRPLQSAPPSPDIFGELAKIERRTVCMCREITAGACVLSYCCCRWWTDGPLVAYKYCCSGTGSAGLCLLCVVVDRSYTTRERESEKERCNIQM